MSIELSAASQMVTIERIGKAISYWMEREPSTDRLTISRPARKLSDIYGEMLYARSSGVPIERLTEEQAAFLLEAESSVPKTA